MPWSALAAATSWVRIWSVTTRLVAVAEAAAVVELEPPVVAVVPPAAVVLVVVDELEHAAKASDPTTRAPVAIHRPAVIPPSDHRRGAAVVPSRSEPPGTRGWARRYCPALPAPGISVRRGRR